METIRRLYRDTSGATMVEYSLMLGFIALVVVLGAEALGTSLNNKFTEVAAGFGS
jgi:pilus assembly protein Flp/PilA